MAKEKGKFGEYNRKLIMPWKSINRHIYIKEYELHSNL